MRSYRIHYLAESNDQATDFELDIEADNILEAIYKFGRLVQLFKRITKVEEL